MEYKRSYSLELDFDAFDTIKTNFKFKQYDRGTSEILITPLKANEPMILEDEIAVMMYKTKKEVINKVENSRKIEILNDSKAKYSDKYKANNEPDHFEEIITYSDYLRDMEGNLLKTKCKILSNNTISAIVDKRVLNETGNIQAELVIYSSQENRITSPLFDFTIIPSIGDTYTFENEEVIVPILTDENLELKTDENLIILSI